MKKASLSGGGSELEEKFFSQRDKELLQNLRERLASKERKRALADASGITDESLLDQLDKLEVRGEGIMTKSVWQALNEKNAAAGKPLFANTRNAAAGSLRQLDPKLAAERRLDFCAWDIAQLEGWPKKPTTHAEEHALLRKFGFKVEKHDQISKNLDEVKEFIKKIEKAREHFDFGTDGVVTSVNNVALHPRLGVVGKAPRKAIAFKFPLITKINGTKLCVCSVITSLVLTSSMDSKLP